MHELEKLRIVASDVPLKYLKDSFPELNVYFFKREIDELTREYVLRGLFGLYGKKKPKKLKNRPDNVRMKLALDKYTPTCNGVKNKVENLRLEGLDPNEFLKVFKDLARDQTSVFFDIFVVPSIDMRVNWLRTIASNVVHDDKFGWVTSELLCDYFCANIKDVPLDWINEQYHCNDQLPQRFGRSLQLQSAHSFVSDIFKRTSLRVEDRGGIIVSYLMRHGCSLDDVLTFLSLANTLNAELCKKEVISWINQHLKKPGFFTRVAPVLPKRHKEMRLFLTQMDLFSQIDDHGCPHVFYVYTVQGLDEVRNEFVPVLVLTREIPVTEQDLNPDLSKLFIVEELDRSGNALQPVEQLPDEDKPIILNDRLMEQYIQNRFREQKGFFNQWEDANVFEASVSRLQRWLSFNFLQHYDEILQKQGISLPADDLEVTMDPQGYKLFYRFHPHFKQTYQELSSQAFEMLKPEDFPKLQFVVSSSLSTPIGDIVKAAFPNVVTQIAASYDFNSVLSYINDYRSDKKTLPSVTEVFGAATSYSDLEERVSNWVSDWGPYAEYGIGPYCLALLRKHKRDAAFFKLPTSLRRLVATPEPFLGLMIGFKPLLSFSTCTGESFKQVVDFTLAIAKKTEEAVCYNSFKFAQNLTSGLNVQKRNLDKSGAQADNASTEGGENLSDGGAVAKTGSPDDANAAESATTKAEAESKQTATKTTVPLRPVKSSMNRNSLASPKKLELSHLPLSNGAKLAQSLMFSESKEHEEQSSSSSQGMAVLNEKPHSSKANEAMFNEMMAQISEKNLSKFKKNPNSKFSSMFKNA